MTKIIFILAIIFGILIIPGSADIFGDMSQKIPVYNQNADKVPGVIKSLLGNEEIYGIIDLNDGSKLEVKAVTKDARIIQFAKVGTRITPQNTFYPGILWNSDAKDVPQMALALDASLVHSYADASLRPCCGLGGMYDVYVAYHNIGTQKNHLDLPEGDGNYTIAFSHSGGTQTLLKKLQYGKVKADYAVFIAPALISQEDIKNLVDPTNPKVKKVVIVESKQDALYLTEANFKRNYKFYTSNGLPYYAPAVTFLEVPPDFFGLFNIIKDESIDVSGYINDNNIYPNWLPENETFWVGGANRTEQKPFQESANVIVIDDMEFGDMGSINVHHELLG